MPRVFQVRLDVGVGVLKASLICSTRFPSRKIATRAGFHLASAQEQLRRLSEASLAYRVDVPGGSHPRR